jgi:hypothetical protein
MFFTFCDTGRINALFFGQPLLVSRRLQATDQ